MATVLPSVANPHTGSSMGRPPKLTGLEILVRAHVVLGHPTFEMKLIATIKQAKIMNVGAITKDDIKGHSIAVAADTAISSSASGRHSRCRRASRILLLLRWASVG
jgi:hypothetical protein